MNTLFERKPIPAVYIRHGIDLREQKSIKEVVDGQQRCRAIIDYFQGNFSTRVEDGGQRKTFAQLTNAEREKFLLTPLPVGYLLGATDADVIDIFARINSISKSLNAQEKRNAKFSGEFKQFCLNFATKNLPFWRATNIFSANDIARMNEVLFASDLIYNMMNGLSDFRPADIDRVYRENDDEFQQADDIDSRLSRIFDVLAELDPSVFKETVFRRPPIFFSLVMFLDGTNGPIRNDLAEKIHEIDAEFLDEDNTGEEITAFRNAVSASTQRIASRMQRQEFLNQRL